MRTNGAQHQPTASGFGPRWYRTEDRRDRVCVWVGSRYPAPRTIVLPDGRAGRLLFERGDLDRGPLAGDFSLQAYPDECLDDIAFTRAERHWPLLKQSERERYDGGFDEFAAAVHFILESDALEYGVHDLAVLDDETAQVLGHILSETAVSGSEGSRSFQCDLDGRAADWGQEAHRGPAPSLTERI